jgi:hypothetical protein
VATWVIARRAKSPFQNPVYASSTAHNHNFIQASMSRKQPVIVFFRKICKVIQQENMQLNQNQHDTYSPSKMELKYFTPTKAPLQASIVILTMMKFS